MKAGTIASLSAAIPLTSVIDALGQEVVTQDGLYKVPPEIEAERADFSEEVFSRYINTDFRIMTSLFTLIHLELIKVSRWDPESGLKVGKTAKLDTFSVIFRGPRNTKLESRTYRVSHAAMGTFELFLSPVNDHRKERFYQAVFNRLAQ